MSKLYIYSYNDSIAASRPMTAENMVKHIENGILRYHAEREKYKVYELVPVEMVTKTVTTFERTSK